MWDDINAHPSFKENTVSFDITGDSSHYLDLSYTELWLKVRLQRKKEKSTEIEDASFDDNKSDVGPVNNILHSLFQQVQIYLNGREVENTNSNYAYKAYIANLLSFNRESKETFLAMEGFVKDTPGQMDNVQCVAVMEDDPKSTTTPKAQRAKEFVANKGLIARYNLFKKSQPIQLRARLQCDIFNINRYLLSNVNMTVKLTRSKPEFYLMGTSERHMINIEETFLRVRRVKIAPSVMVDHAMALEKATAKYPIKRVIVKQFTLPYNANKASICGIHSGIMPTRVVFGFLGNQAYDGTLATNPFNFRNLDITHLSLKISSKSVPYSSGIEMDYTNNCYMQAYNTLYQNIRESANDITYSDYKSGYTLYAFDLSPDLCTAEHFNIFKDGSLDLDIDFKTAIQESLTTIFYLEFDNIIEITKQRNVIFDYQV